MTVLLECIYANYTIMLNYTMTVLLEYIDRLLYILILIDFLFCTGFCCSLFFVL